MNDQIVFHGVFPIGDTDTNALPVEDMETAVSFYSKAFGFKLVERTGNTAVLERDSARIGLAINGLDPEQASCYFSVSDVDALREEITGNGLEATPIQDTTHEGKKQRIFFAKEPYGVCFCFGQQEKATE